MRLRAIVWATLYGLGSYLLGTVVYRLAGPLGWGLLGLTGCLLLVLMVLLHRQEQRWEEHAVRLFPGPLAHYLGAGMNRQARQGERPTIAWQRTHEEAPGYSHLGVQAAATRTRETAVAPRTALQRRVASNTGVGRTPLRPIHLERFSS